MSLVVASVHLHLRLDDIYNGEISNKIKAIENGMRDKAIAWFRQISKPFQFFFHCFLSRSLLFSSFRLVGIYMSAVCWRIYRRIAASHRTTQYQRRYRNGQRLWQPTNGTHFVAVGEFVGRRPANGRWQRSIVDAGWWQWQHIHWQQQLRTETYAQSTTSCPSTGLTHLR